MTEPRDEAVEAEESGEEEAPSEEEVQVRAAKFPIATCVEISVIGIFPATDYPTLQAIAEKLQEELKAKFIEAGGKDPHGRWAEARPATKEEVLHFTPRKVHMSERGRQICDTVYVAKRNLTRDREKVTCKLCRRKMGIETWEPR